MKEFNELITKLYVNTEKMRDDLWELAHYTVTPDELGNTPYGYKDWTASYKDGMIEVYIPDYPPRMEFARKVSSLRRWWMDGITSVLCSIIPTPHFDSAFIWFSMYFPGDAPAWDVDNRIYKYMINAVRYSKVIDDDTYDKMSFGIEGHTSQNPHTEMYIVERKDIQKLFQKLTKMETQNSQ